MKCWHQLSSFEITQSTNMSMRIIQTLQLVTSLYLVLHIDYLDFSVYQSEANRTRAGLNYNTYGHPISVTCSRDSIDSFEICL